MEMQDSKKRIFEDDPIPKAVAALTIPTVLSSLVMMLYNLADTYFVGVLNDAAQTAAVTLAAPVLLAFNAVNNLFGVGSSSMMSRALGRKDYETAYKSSAFGFYCALFFGVLFSLLCILLKTPLLNILGADEITAKATEDYLLWTVFLGAAPAILNVVMAHMVRAEGSALHSSIGTMSGCLLNIILDPIFILPWGLNMGAAGAGCATFISNCFACIYYLVLFRVKRGKTFVCISPRKFTLDGSIVKGVCGVGIPASIQNLLNVTGMTVLNNFTAAFGADAVAAMGIAHKVNMIPMYIAMGIGQGIMPLVSYNYASGNIDRMKNGFNFAAKISIGLLSVMTVGYFAFAEPIIGLFMEKETIIAYGGSFLRGMCLAMPFFCYDFLGVGVYQACGMGRYSLAFAIMRKVVLEIPALFILNRLWPLYGLAYAQTVTEVILGIVAWITISRLFKRFYRERELNM